MTRDEETALFLRSQAVRLRLIAQRLEALAERFYPRERPQPGEQGPWRRAGE